MPANEQTKFRQFIGTIPVSDIVKSPLSETVVTNVGRIIGKDASKYERISISGDDSKSILVGTKNKNDYSQFHFGAGEASIIEMVSKIEDSPNNSLILIEEIENGLHPLATRKMIEYLFDVAIRKKSQIVFTSHSEYALSVLPPHAIWACVDGTAYQGKLSVESLRALTGSVTKSAAIFVEDEFAKDLVDEMMRQYALDKFDQIEVHKAGGYPWVVQVLNHHIKNPTTKTEAVAIIDGDNPELTEPNERVLVLPEGLPEAVVYSYIHNNAESCSALIQQRCQCPSIEQDKIVKAIKDVKIDTTEGHLYFKKLGERLGFISELIIRRGMCSIYVEKNKELLEPIVKTALEKLKLAS